MGKVVAIIQARMQSTRLPSKVMAEISGHPMLWHVWKRVNRAKRIDEAIIAMPSGTPTNDLPKARYFFGSENDVLKRYVECNFVTGANVIVRITADCPLIDPALIDRMIESHLIHKPDLTTNVEPPTWPDGEDIEIFDSMALWMADANAKLPSDREHVTPWIKRTHKVLNVPYPGYGDLSHLRWTVDEPSDLEFVRAVYGELWNEYAESTFGIDDVLSLLRRQPELANINAGIARNEGLAKSLKEDRVV